MNQIKRRDAENAEARGEKFLCEARRSLHLCFLLFPVLGFCILLSGCFPFHYTTRPGLSGQVVNAANLRPLSNAAISFWSQTNTATDAFSAGDGYFVVPPKRQWGIWIIPQDVFARPITVCVQHTGFESNFKKISFSPAETGKASTKPLGIFALQPLPQ